MPRKEKFTLSEILLLRSYANNSTPQQRIDHLSSAAAIGDKVIVKVLIEALTATGTSVDALSELEQLPTGNQRTALHLAASNGHVDILNLLLDAGANIDVVDNTEKTALDLAKLSLEEDNLLTDKKEALEKIVQIIEATAKLHAAASAEDIGEAQLNKLLGNGANINAVGKARKTALAIAESRLKEGQESLFVQILKKAAAASTPEPEATSTPEPEATSMPEPEATSMPEPEATSTPEKAVAPSTPEPEATSTPEKAVAPSTPEPETKKTEAENAYTAKEALLDYQKHKGTFARRVMRFFQSFYYAFVDKDHRLSDKKDVWVTEQLTEPTLDTMDVAALKEGHKNLVLSITGLNKSDKAVDKKLGELEKYLDKVGTPKLTK